MSYGQNARGYPSRTTSSFSRPVETGKELTVEVTDNGRGGEGIARIQGFVILVNGAKGGDKNIEVKVNSVGNRFATVEGVAG